MNASCNWVDWFRSLQFSSVYMLSVNLNTNRHLSLITVSSNPTGGGQMSVHAVLDIATKALKMQDQKMQDLKMRDLLGMRRAFVVRYSEH